VTSPQGKSANPTLARIHILKDQLGMADDAYRGMLEAKYGVRSSKDLSQEQRADLAGLLDDMLMEAQTGLTRTRTDGR